MNFWGIKADITKNPADFFGNLIRGMQDLVYWQGGADHFNAVIYNLISKADNNNKELLRKGFPYHVLSFEIWQECPSHDDFLDFLKCVKDLQSGEME